MLSGGAMGFGVAVQHGWLLRRHASARRWSRVLVGDGGGVRGGGGFHLPSGGAKHRHRREEACTQRSAQKQGLLGSPGEEPTAADGALEPQTRLEAHEFW